MSPQILIFAVLALAGAIVPWTYNLEFMQGGAGFDLVEFFASGFVNPGAASLTVDLMIGSSAFLLFMILEARRLKMRWWGLYVLVSYCVAFACAAPLFLMMRERHLAAA
jgi:hypothetical protein